MRLRVARRVLSVALPHPARRAPSSVFSHPPRQQAFWYGILPIIQKWFLAMPFFLRSLCISHLGATIQLFFSLRKWKGRKHSTATSWIQMNLISVLWMNGFLGRQLWMGWNPRKQIHGVASGHVPARDSVLRLHNIKDTEQTFRPRCSTISLHPPFGPHPCHCICVSDDIPKPRGMSFHFGVWVGPISLGKNRFFFARRRHNQTPFFSRKQGTNGGIDRTLTIFALIHIKDCQQASIDTKTRGLLVPDGCLRSFALDAARWLRPENSCENFLCQSFNWCDRERITTLFTFQKEKIATEISSFCLYFNARWFTSSKQL